MPKVKFEPTIQAFERAKTVHVLDRAVTLIDSINYLVGLILINSKRNRFT
jgi:hypothetical protein